MKQREAISTCTSRFHAQVPRTRLHESVNKGSEHCSCVCQEMTIQHVVHIVAGTGEGRQCPHRNFTTLRSCTKKEHPTSLSLLRTHWGEHCTGLRTISVSTTRKTHCDSPPSGYEPRRATLSISCILLPLCSLSFFLTRNGRAPSGVTSKAPQHCCENNCHNIHYYDDTGKSVKRDTSS